jgi:hypothetical protein
MRIKLLLVMLLYTISVFAQQPPCAFDAVRKIKFNSDAAYRLQEEKVNRLLYNQGISANTGNKNSSVPLQIPVVVHVVHQNGAENISDSLIVAAIDQLNLRYQNVAPFYDTTGNDIQIQFCLATIDPSGNPTNGITRNVSAYTDVIWVTGPEDVGLKNLNRWDPHLYLNIWVIRSIISMYNYVGYAFYPSSAGNAEDGIVIQFNYMNNNLLAHEAGHYLGLYHTFESGCTNENCLLDGDHICDTPPDSTNDFVCPANSCSSEMSDTSGFNPFTADVNDLPNYMDYTYCPLSFTAMQSDRMNASLSQLRSTLLLSNGCGQNPGGGTPVASFTYASTCNGTVFTNTSINSVGAQWDTNSDGSIDNAGNSITYNFPATGYYQVTMYAQGYGGIDTITQTILSQTYPSQSYPLYGFSGASGSLYTGELVFCEGSTVSFFGAPGMVSYDWSTGDTTQLISLIGGNTALNISLTAVDSAGYSWTTCYPLHIEPAPSTIPATVSVAGNDTSFCIGDTVTLLFSYSPIIYNSNLYLNSGFINGFQDSSYQISMINFNSIWIMQTDSNGCASNSNSLFLTADFPTVPQQLFQNGSTLTYFSGSHYQWYFNGVPMASSDTTSIQMLQTGCYRAYSWWTNYECGSFSSDSVCIIINDIADAGNNEPVRVFPNPSHGEFSISAAKGVHERTLVILTDAIGRKIMEKVWERDDEKINFNTTALSPGIYTLQLYLQNRLLFKKIVIN